MKPPGIIMNEDHRGCLSEAKAERERERFCDMRSLASFSFWKEAFFLPDIPGWKMTLGRKRIGQTSGLREQNDYN